MKTVIYIRVSALDQNPARQEKALKEWAERTGSTRLVTIKEKVSGTVPMAERKFARIFDMEDVERVVVEHVDRLGRDALDIQQTIKQLIGKGINVTITSLGLDTLLPNGKINDAAQLVIGILSQIAELEKRRSEERQRQGIEVAKAQGKYQGRVLGTGITVETYLEKYAHVVRELKRGTSIRRTGKLCSVSTTTVQKVKQAMNEQEGNT